MKSNYEKPSEKKKRIKTENIKRIKKLQRLKSRYQFKKNLEFKCRQVKLSGLAQKRATDL